MGSPFFNSMVGLSESKTQIVGYRTFGIDQQPTYIWKKTFPNIRYVYDIQYIRSELYFYDQNPMSNSSTIITYLNLTVFSSPLSFQPVTNRWIVVHKLLDHQFGWPCSTRRVGVWSGSIKWGPKLDLQMIISQSLLHTKMQ